jgi:hypothetical protein
VVISATATGASKPGGFRSGPWMNLERTDNGSGRAASDVARNKSTNVDRLRKEQSQMENNRKKRTVMPIPKLEAENLADHINRARTFIAKAVEEDLQLLRGLANKEKNVVCKADLVRAVGALKASTQWNKLWSENA